MRNTGKEKQDDKQGSYGNWSENELMSMSVIKKFFLELKRGRSSRNVDRYSKRLKRLYIVEDFSSSSLGAQSLE